MATHHGNEGKVYLGANQVAEIDGWELSQSIETADDTAMGDTARTHLTGKYSWQGSITCLWDETDTNGQVAMTVGASVTLNLYPEGNDSGDTYYTGTATITSRSHPVAQDDVQRVTFEFLGNGALSTTTVGA